MTPEDEAPAEARVPVKHRDLEDLLGANWLAKAGIALLGLGLVFLFQYAIAQGWLSLPLQIVAGALAGVVLFVVGDHLFARRNMGVYGQILAGGGAAIAYFSVFSSYAFDAYREATGMTLESASLLMGVVALGAFAHAVWRKTPVLASVASAMGASTVIFANEWSAFVIPYVLVLTGAVMGASWWRSWGQVAGIAFAAALTSLLIGGLIDLAPAATIWSVAGVAVLALLVAVKSRWSPLGVAVMPSVAFVLAIMGFEDPLNALYAGGVVALVSGAVAMTRLWHVAHLVSLFSLYVCLFFVAVAGEIMLSAAASVTFTVILIVTTGIIGLYYAGAAVFLSRRVGPADQSVVGASVMLALLGAWGLVALALGQAGWGDATGWVTLGLAVGALAAAALPWFEKTLRLGWLGAGVVLALSWPPILTEGVPVTVVWAAYLAALGAIVFFRRGIIARVCIGVTATLVLFHLLVFNWPDLMSGELGPWSGLLLFGLVTAAFFVAWLAESRQDATHMTSGLLLTPFTLVPILYFAAVLEGFVVSIAWAGQALAFVIVGFVFGVRVLRLAGLGVFGLVLFRLLVFDMQEVDPALRIITFIVVGAVLLLAAYFFARRMRENEQVPDEREAQ